jgi:hypothetical protein
MIPTGYIPSFMHEIETNRLPYPKEKFTPPEWYLAIKGTHKDAA